ncbi:MAG: CHAP domain-containing protein [Abditibacteriales bacterium]|nr:CHAP domain-containing protein [Abditibacteriales bacterium]MDW8367710.1 CHAP domain-containing protein [Abditibacteriales bacterium]
MKALVQKAIDIALSQKGVREEGENAGKKVEEFLRSVGLGPGYPWCAAFVYWCTQKAADALKVSNPFIRTAGCAVIASWAREHDILEDTPEAGDVFLHWSTVAGVFRASHTGFVTKVRGAQFDTIEGNTNAGGSREGIGVFARKRTNGDRYRFVRWSRLVDEAPDAKYTLFVNDTKVCEMPVRNGRSLCPIRRWGEFLGFKVEWNADLQVPLFDGKEVQTETVLLGGVAYAPIRDLVEAAGLKLKVDVPNRKVIVTRG